MCRKLVMCPPPLHPSVSAANWCLPLTNGDLHLSHPSTPPPSAPPTPPTHTHIHILTLHCDPLTTPFFYFVKINSGCRSFTTRERRGVEIICWIEEKLHQKYWFIIQASIRYQYALWYRHCGYLDGFTPVSAAVKTLDLAVFIDFL